MPVKDEVNEVAKRIGDLARRIADIMDDEDEREVVYACAAVIGYTLRDATPEEHDRMVDSVTKYIRKWHTNAN